MLIKQLQADNGFIASEWVDGVLFKAEIRSIPDREFCTQGMNKLIASLGIKFSDISYVKPRMDTPCMYGACDILGDSIAVESQLAWKDLMRIKRVDGGVFHISIHIEGPHSDEQRLVVSWDVENVSIDSIKMSPVIKLLKEAQN